MTEASVELEEIAVGSLVFETEVAGAQGAPLVLLLHGFPQTSHTWRHQLPALADAGFFAAAPNQRGYSPGARPEGAEHYATASLLEDVLGVAAALGYARFHLVGHDWGGQLAWLLAAHHAEHIETLTVLSRPHPRAFAQAMAADDAQAHRSRHHRAFQDPDSARLLLADDARRLKTTLAEQGVRAAAIAAYLERLGNESALDAAINWYRSVGRSESALIGANVPDVSVQTLYLWGNADATVGRFAVDATASCVTGPYRLVVVPGAGHFLTDQDPERVTGELLAHLDA